MNHQEYIEDLENQKHFSTIRNAVLNDLYSFLVGKVCSLTFHSPIMTAPNQVLSYLHIFISEGSITNDNINTEITKFSIEKKEDVWLLLLYIEAQLLYTKHRTEEKVKPLVDINLDLLVYKIKSVWKEYKDEYTVKYFTENIYKLTTQKIFED